MARRFRLLTMVSAMTLALAACGQTPAPAMPATSLIAGETLAPIDPETVAGPIEITGSSTVYPLTAQIVEEFHADGSPAQIEVKVTGTGGGFRSFCNGDPVDIVNASRPITDDEAAACRAAGREPLGFQVGVDALAVVVSNQNTFVEALTFEQLAAIFSGEARRWRDVNAAYPDEPITVFSPGVDSGTFDYFVEEVLGGDDQRITAIPGIVLSESDTELRTGIEDNPFAIGYFGYAYYRSDEERLRALSIDGGGGAILPGEDTVSNATYPLARPLFIYTGEQTLEQSPTVAAFVSYYLQSVGDVVAGVGYFPVPEATLSEAQQELVAALR
jgi:phosphate transport system substrate-binding protein